MSYKSLQLFPQASTREARAKFTVLSSWSVSPEVLSDSQILRTWFEYDSELAERRAKCGTNWYAVVGLALMVGISGTFWTGVGLIATHCLK